MRRKRNPGGDNLGLILGGIALTGVVVAGLLFWGSARTKAPSSSALPSGGTPRPELAGGVFPDLKSGDFVLVDTAAAKIPAGNLPTLVCQVDIVMSDPTLVSVRSTISEFKGTIPRSSIIRVLPPVAPGVFT